MNARLQHPHHDKQSVPFRPSVTCPESCDSGQRDLLQSGMEDQAFAAGRGRGFWASGSRQKLGGIDRCRLRMDAGCRTAKQKCRIGSRVHCVRVNPPAPTANNRELRPCCYQCRRLSSAATSGIMLPTVSEQGLFAFFPASPRPAATCYKSSAYPQEASWTAASSYTPRLSSCAGRASGATPHAVAS